MTSAPDSLRPRLQLVEPPATKPSYSAGRATVAGLLGVLGAVVLAGGTGFAYAASTDTAESGYLIVVEETTPVAGAGALDCPDASAVESDAR